jgi:hypothetical protein
LKDPSEGAPPPPLCGVHSGTGDWHMFDRMPPRQCRLRGVTSRDFATCVSRRPRRWLMFFGDSNFRFYFDHLLEWLVNGATDYTHRCNVVLDNQIRTSKHGRRTEVRSATKAM